MKKGRIVAGVVVLGLVGLVFWIRYSDLRPPFRFIHADRYRSEHKWSPSFGGGWSSWDYYVFRGDPKLVADEAKKELAGLGTWSGDAARGFYDWTDEKGEFSFYIGPYSPLDHLDDPAKPKIEDSANCVVIHVRRPPSVLERVREWLPGDGH